MTEDNVRLEYTDRGQGVPILLLAGLGSYKELWHPTERFLLNMGFRVICIDERNQGSSEHTVLGRRMSRHGKDLAEVLDALKLDHFIAIGNSMGVATIFSYISLFGDSKLSGFVDIDQSPKMVNDENWQLGYKGLTWSEFPEILRLPMAKANIVQIDDETRDLVQNARLKHPYDAELNYPLRLDHNAQDWRDVLGTMKVPFLAIAGAKSPYFNPDFAKISSEIALNGEYEIVEDAGHLVMAEQPERFNQILGEFLNQIES